MLSAIHTKIPWQSSLPSSRLLSQSPIKGASRKKPAAAAAKAAAILERQQRDAEEQTRRDEEFRQRVEKGKKRRDSSPANEGKTWTSYVS
jgi:hypothetical protein